MDTNKEDVRRYIISDMVKKRNSIIPVIVEDTYFFGVPLSYGALKLIRSAVEEGSKVIQGNTLLTQISSEIVFSNIKVNYHFGKINAIFNTMMNNPYNKYTIS